MNGINAYEPGKILILGAQRSGTTVFSYLLAKHPDLLLAVNGKLLYYLIIWVLKNQPFLAGSHIRLAEIAYSINRMPVGGITAKECKALQNILLNQYRQEKITFTSPEETIRFIWSTCYPQIRQCKMFGEKYNENLLYINDIISVIPDCKYIFIKRNGYHAANSLVKKFAHKPWGTANYNDALKKWADWNSKWVEFRSSILLENKIEIKYEDLLADPAKTAGTICAFLHIPIPSGFCELWAKEIHCNNQKIQKQSSFSTPEIDRVLRELGYDIESH